MSIAVALHHVTHYKYDQPVSLGPQVIRLRPAPHTRTRVSSYSLKVLPEKHFVNWQQDPQGNWLARYVFRNRLANSRSRSISFADMAVVNPFDFFVEPYAEAFPFQYPSDLADELAPYLKTEPATPLLAQYLASIPREAPSTVNFLSISTRSCATGSATSFVWSPASRRRRKRCKAAQGRAATRHGS